MAVIDATFAVVKKKPEKKKKSRLYGIQTLDLCNAGAALLPTELTSQLRAGHWIGSL